MTNSSFRAPQLSYRVTPLSSDDRDNSHFSLNSVVYGHQFTYARGSNYHSHRGRSGKKGEISKLRSLWSIQSVVPSVFILVVLITAISVWLPTFLSARESLKDNALINSNRLDRMVKEFTTHLVQDSIKLSTTIWTSIYFDNSLLDLNNELELRRIMFCAMNSIPSVGSAFIGRNDGYITSLIRQPTEILTQTTLPNGTMYYYRVDPKTCEKVDTPLRSVKYGDVHLANWFMAASKARGISWTAVFAGKASNSSIISLGRAVYNSTDTTSYTYEKAPENANLLAVVGTSFFLDVISGYLKMLDVGKRGRIFIVERSGIMVATSVGSANSLGNDGSIIPMSVLNHPDRVIREAATYLWKKHGSSFANIKEDYFRLSTTKDNLIVQISVFQDSYGLDWLIISLLSYDEMYGKIRNGTIISGVVSASSLVAAIIVAIILGTIITIPIRQVTHQLHKVANMELDSPKKSRNTGKLLYEISNMQLALSRMKDGLQNFAKFVPGDLVRQLLRSGESAEPSVRSAQLTVCFTDVIGFTSIAENTSPNILVTVMQEFFTFANQLIAQQEGTIDKYIGDCVMSFWGAPEPITDPEIKAVTAAYDLKKLLEARNQEWKDKGYPTINVRTGINSAKCLVGNIGAPSRLNYTALGDGVNLAARLESLNNQYKTRIMIGQTTYEKVKDVFACRWLDYVTVKGKDVPIHVYEVVGLRDYMSTQEISDQVDQFTKLRDLLIEQRVDEVIRICQTMMDNMTDEAIEKHYSLNILYTRLMKNPSIIYHRIDEK